MTVLRPEDGGAESLAPPKVSQDTCTDVYGETYVSFRRKISWRSCGNVSDMNRGCAVGTVNPFCKTSCQTHVKQP